MRGSFASPVFPSEYNSSHEGQNTVSGREYRITILATIEACTFGASFDPFPLSEGSYQTCSGSSYTTTSRPRHEFRSRVVAVSGSTTAPIVHMDRVSCKAPFACPHSGRALYCTPVEQRCNARRKLPSVSTVAETRRQGRMAAKRCTNVLSLDTTTFGSSDDDNTFLFNVFVCSSCE